MRVLIADEYPNVLEALGVLLQTDRSIEIVGQVSTASALVPQVECRHPDVVLMEASSPHFPGIELTRQIVQLLPSTGVVLIATNPSMRESAEAADAGALGYLTVESVSRDLFDAVWGVYAARHQDHDSHPHPDGPQGPASDEFDLEPLSAVERYILRHWSAGMTVRQIASGACLPCSAIEAYLERLRARIRPNDLPEFHSAVAHRCHEGHSHVPARRALPPSYWWSPLCPA